MATKKILSGVSQPAWGSAPYGDMQEVTGAPTFEVIPEPYRPFFATDARTVMIILHPNHYNFFINPAFRVNANGWETTATGPIPTAVATVQTTVGTNAGTNKTSLEAIRDANPEGTVVQITDAALASTYYSLDPANTIPQASVPFPHTGDLVGWRFYGTGTNAISDRLDPNDSWVGKSMRVSGEGIVRFRAGTNKFVYVGPSKDLDQQDWYEPGRCSAQWTFSAYVKGSSRIDTGPFDPPARVRLVMEAYRSSDPTVAGSPPINVNLPVVSNPAIVTSAPDEKVLGGNGNVWVRNDPPFYRPLGKVPTSATDPLQIKATGPFPPAILEPYLLYSGKIYRLKSQLPETAGVTYYTDMGTPTTVITDPRTMVQPMQNYLLLNLAGDPRNGEHWEVIAPPYYHDTGSEPYFSSVQGQWHNMVGNDWFRLIEHTDAWTAEGEGKVSFAGCFWIDARLEFENCADLRVSSFMLNPTELFSQYFDGSMTEETVNDDFIWSEVYAENGDYVTQKANQCISFYYYDRLARVRWLWENLKYVVPVDRPYQIFFGDFDRPYIVPRGSSSVATRELSL